MLSSNTDCYRLLQPFRTAKDTRPDTLLLYATATLRYDTCTTLSQGADATRGADALPRR
jgi:hypothetical protein